MVTDVMNHLSLAQSFFPNELLHIEKLQLMTNGKNGQISLKDTHTQAGKQADEN